MNRPLFKFIIILVLLSQVAFSSEVVDREPLHRLKFGMTEASIETLVDLDEEMNSYAKMNSADIDTLIEAKRSLLSSRCGVDTLTAVGAFLIASPIGLVVATIDGGIISPLQSFFKNNSIHFRNIFSSSLNESGSLSRDISMQYSTLIGSFAFDCQAHILQIKQMVELSALKKRLEAKAAAKATEKNN
jgi:hypothetical protein